MVGDPKHLSDLTQIEADVRIVCRDCHYEDDWTVEALARHLHLIGGNTTWSEITRYMTCRRFSCGSRRLKALVVPYARRQPNLKRRIGKYDEQLIGAAVGVLQDIVARSPGREVATLDLRLALLVVHRYMRDPKPIRELWERAGNAQRPAASGLQEPMAVIRYRLEQGGWLAPEVLLEDTRRWVWDSPPPKGWLPRAGEVRQDN
ncbi:hypothetical protein SAMN05192583_1032 [Sphingomonas gellani]|uniref:Uncharacterized protein n=1 Tax=Sphingomonas gellani TaxID=1166340 RepID=A0A1H8AS15_9SPHN|nr:hypothetical protein [Sphingomonas gellani]SEM73353.1 hypothetical protein SAMN05192583_1032 [Sphingomonas gellani]